MPSTSTRRRFLLTAAASSLVVAGCMERQSESDEPTEATTETPGTATRTKTPTETPEPTPTDAEPATPREEPPTPHPDSHSHEVLRIDSYNRQLKRPDATGFNDSFQMAYLQSANDLDKFDQEALNEDERTFLDDTDFDAEVVVAVGVGFPNMSSESYVTGVFRHPDHVETSIWLKHRPGGPHGRGYELVYVRVPFDDDPPDDATVLIENNLFDDYRPVEFGTTDDG